MRSKKRVAKTYTDEDTNSDQLRPRKRNTKPSTSQGTQPMKKYQTRKQTASNTPTPKHISKSLPNRPAPKTPTNKTTSTSQPNRASPKRTYVPQLRSSPKAVMKIFSEMSADLREEHKKILETTPFSHIFTAIIDRKVSESFITKTDKHICQIFAAFVDEKSGFNIVGKMMNLKTRDIQLILGIKSGGVATIQKTKSQKQEWALYERRFKNYEKVNLPALKEEIKKVVKQTDEQSLNDFASMACLLLIHTLLFTTTGNSINLTHAKYCQSVDSLCAINWAALAKEMLISEIGSKKDNKPLTVTGCTIVMLYWLCECTTIIEPNKELEDNIPRLLKWDLRELSKAMNKTPLSEFKYENIKTDPLMPTETEIKELNLSASNERSSQVYVHSQICNYHISQPSPTVKKGKEKEKIVERMDARNAEEKEEKEEKENEKEEKEVEGEEECENERMHYDENFLESQEVDDSLEEGVDPTRKTCPSVNLNSDNPVQWEDTGNQVISICCNCKNALLDGPNAGPSSNVFQQTQSAIRSGTFHTSNPTVSSQSAFASITAFGSTSMSESRSTGSTIGVSSSPAFWSGSEPSSTFTYSSSSFPAFVSSSTPGFAENHSLFRTFPAPSGAQTTRPSFGQTVYDGLRKGSKIAAYVPTTEVDCKDTKGAGKLKSISAMPIYRNISHEELRWEDFQLRDEGNSDKSSMSEGQTNLNVNPNGVCDDEYISTTLPGHRSSEAPPPIMYEPGTDVESMIPKLHDSEYYTEPCIEELTAKERVEPGFCCHVKDFVVGRYGYGCIKFLGQTDVRQLDLESIVQFNYREVIVYMDESTKPPVGQDLNKPAEITLLNVKCLDKKTGTHWTDGAKVDKYKKMLIKRAKDQGAEFVSYNPVIGEWKFSVQHF